MSQNRSSSQLQRPARWRSYRLPPVGDWLAPLIVLFVVIAMTLAIAGMLLGEE